MGILRLYHILPFSPSSYYHRCQVEAEQLKFSSFMRMCLAVFPLLGFLMQATFSEFKDLVFMLPTLLHDTISQQRERKSTHTI